MSVGVHGYKGLLGSCVYLRQGARQLVTTVRLSARWQQEVLAYLTSSSLRHLDLSRGSMTELVIDPSDIDNAEGSFYRCLATHGNWPCLQSLHHGLLLPADNVHLLLWAAHWPALMSLTFCGYHKDLAAVIAECMRKWPALKFLTVQTQHLQRDTFDHEVSIDLVRQYKKCSTENG